MLREQSSSKQKMLKSLLGTSTPFLGLGFIWAWIYCAYDASMASPSASLSSGAYLIVLAAVVISLIGSGFALRKVDLSRSPRLWGAASIMVALGTLTPPFARGLNCESAACNIANGLSVILIGLGYAWLCIAWADVLTRIEPEQAEIAVPAASGVLMVCAFIFPSLNETVGLVTTALLPMISGILLASAYGVIDSANSSTITVNETDHGAKEQTVALENPTGIFGKASLARILIILACSYSVICFIDAASAPYDPQSTVFDVPDFIGGAMGVGLAVSITLFSVSIGFHSLFRWLVPLMVASIAALAIDPQGTSPLCAAVMSGADVCIQAIVYLYFIQLARRRQLSIALGIGLGQGFLQLGVLLGNAAAQVMAPSLSAGGLTAACLILIVVLVCAEALLPTREEHGRVTAPLAMANQSDDETEDSALKVDAAVEAIAKAYGLSNRETEILGYLARGRSQPYIRETLVLSKSTVSTHVRHIYGKLDVHSRQELLDKLEECAGQKAVDSPSP